MKIKFADRLQKFSEEKIGLERNSLCLEPYNQKWKRLFSDEAYLIFDQLRNESLRLYHIGSTSIANIDSKPIIDILGSVSSLENLDLQKMQIEQIGYESKGEHGIKGRRYFVLYNSDKTVAFVHLHIFENNDLEIDKLLLFRDRLRKNQELAREYSLHKHKIMSEPNISRGQYSELKNDFIFKILSSKEESTGRKKILAILGAAQGHVKTKSFLLDTFSDNELEIIDMNDAEVKPYVYSKNQSDHFCEIINKAIAADLIVLATPVYWYAMSGSMKDFMDRFSDLMSGEFKSLGESLYGKRVQLVSTGYDESLPLGFEVPFAATAIYFGMDYMGARYNSTRS